MSEENEDLYLNLNSSVSYDEKWGALEDTEEMKKEKQKLDEAAKNLIKDINNIFFFEPTDDFSVDFEALKKLLMKLSPAYDTEYRYEIIELFLWLYEVTYNDHKFSSEVGELTAVSYFKNIYTMSYEPEKIDSGFFERLKRLVDVTKYYQLNKSFFSINKKFDSFEGIMQEALNFIMTQYGKAGVYINQNLGLSSKCEKILRVKNTLEEYQEHMNKVNSESDDKNQLSHIETVSATKSTYESSVIAKKFLKQYKVPDIYNYIDRYVYKQEVAKKTVSLMLYNHMVRIANPKEKIEKSNYLMFGPSGCGKTEITRAISKICPLPVLTIDCANVTGPGWKGLNFADAVAASIERLDKSKRGLVEKGIFFLDEADKMLVHAKDKENVNFGIAMQSTMLKLLEECELTSDEGQLILNGEYVTFVLAGAFSGMLDDKDILKIAGFNNENAKKTKKTTYSMSEVSQKIIDYGMMPELAGRTSNLIPLNSLSIDDFVYILKNYENSSVINLTKLYALQGIKLSFEDKALRKAAIMAKERNLGVRGANAIINSAVDMAVYNAIEQNKNKVKITEQALADKVISV